MTTQTTNQAASGATNGNGNGKAMVKAPTRMEILKKGFEDWRPTLRAVLPRHIDPERVIKIAMNVYLNKPELQDCTPISMIKATISCAELGLEPSPLLGEAWFLPFENKKRVKDGNVYKDVKVPEVQLMPGYVGLVKLAKQTGDISDVYAVAVDESEKVPEFDERGRLIAGFYVEEGTNRAIHHIRRMEGRTGKLFAVYGVVKFKDGTNHFEVMSLDEVEAIRKRSKAKDNGPWVTDFTAMAKKTAIKQALKTVPKSPEKPALAHALAADTAVETGEAFTSPAVNETAIDVEGVDVTNDAPAAAAKTSSRADELGAILGQSPAHDPETGEVRS